MDNSTFFRRLADGARSLPGAAVALGGNAPVMASRFYKEGCDVLLGAKMTDWLQSQMPADIKGFSDPKNNYFIFIIFCMLLILYSCWWSYSGGGCSLDHGV
jgi:ADP-dependent glucokinase